MADILTSRIPDRSTLRSMASRNPVDLTASLGEERFYLSLGSMVCAVYYRLYPPDSVIRA